MQSTKLAPDHRCPTFLGIKSSFVHAEKYNIRSRIIP
jgi:hypothetical protein